ncbi:MAG: GNAT family N-acetyltransferase [Bacilli bacterium]|nr:GNAT family N-acetyltransferase [Bacilli bacterium]
MKHDIKKTTLNSQTIESQNPCIETDRLLLRKLKKEDAEPMFKNWASDEEVTKYMTWISHENIEVTKKIIGLWSEEENDPRTIRFMITLKDSGEPIGAIDVVKYIDGNPEIGYCLSRKYWNQGLMTEVCKAFTKYLFAKGFQKIYITAIDENIGSNRVVEKCGFVFTHKERLEHQSSFKHNPVTIHCYELVQ